MAIQDSRKAAPAAEPAALARVEAPRAEGPLVAVPRPRPRAALPVSGKRTWLRPFLALVVIAVAALGGGWYFWWQPFSVATIRPWRGAAIEAVYATGIVEAVDLARVGTTVAGRILALSADEGDAVHKGDVLAQLDDSQPRHRLEDVTARLVQAEKELARGQELVSRGVRTRQDMERAQEERDQAAAGVRLLVRQVEEHRIRAPLDGVVTRRPVQAGETVAANQILFEVGSDARLRIAADVDERDVPLIHPGARMALRSEAFPKEPFSAEVTMIRKAGETTTRTFRVEADLPADTRLRIGMTVDANIDRGT